MGGQIAASEVKIRQTVGYMGKKDVHTHDEQASELSSFSQNVGNCVGKERLKMRAGNSVTYDEKTRFIVYDEKYHQKEFNL